MQVETAVHGYNSWFGLCHVVVALNFLHMNQPCFIVMFLFLAYKIFYRSYFFRQHFRLRSPASLYLVFSFNLFIQYTIFQTHQSCTYFSLNYIFSLEPEVVLSGSHGNKPEYNASGPLGYFFFILQQWLYKIQLFNKTTKHFHSYDRVISPTSFKQLIKRNGVSVHSD